MSKLPSGTTTQQKAFGPSRVISRLFIALALVGCCLWVIGVIAGSVIPIFGGIRTEAIGQIFFAVAALAEVAIYLFGWLARRTER